MITHQNIWVGSKQHVNYTEHTYHFCRSHPGVLWHQCFQVHRTRYTKLISYKLPFVTMWLEVQTGGLGLVTEIPNPVCYDLVTILRIKVFGHKSNKVIPNKTGGQLGWLLYLHSTSFLPTLMFVLSHIQRIFQIK